MMKYGKKDNDKLGGQFDDASQDISYEEDDPNDGRFDDAIEEKGDDDNDIDGYNIPMSDYVGEDNGENNNSKDGDCVVGGQFDDAMEDEISSEINSKGNLMPRSAVSMAVIPPPLHSIESFVVRDFPPKREPSFMEVDDIFEDADENMSTTEEVENEHCVDKNDVIFCDAKKHSRDQQTNHLDREDNNGNGCGHKKRKTSAKSLVNHEKNLTETNNDIFFRDIFTLPSSASQEEETASTDSINSGSKKGDGFVLRPPVSNKEIKSMEPFICRSLQDAVSFYEEHDISTFRSHYLANDNNSGNQKSSTTHLSHAEELKREKTKQNATMNDAPRQYQIDLFQRAKYENIIVHLATGMGKTLIALLCMEYFISSKEQEGHSRMETEAKEEEEEKELSSNTNNSKTKQVWFLVPSVALAVQHTITIQANLPTYKVETACHTSSNSPKARRLLKEAHIVIATHGAALNLLQHYGDGFNLSNVSLLVLDECHYTTRNHGYAQIMDVFYHRLEEEDRPRILGLTASPLINIKKPTAASEERLQLLMSQLESKLDAKIIGYSPSRAYSSKSTDDDSSNCDGETQYSKSMQHQEVEEHLIHYDSSTFVFAPFPCHDADENGSIQTAHGIHKSRVKELNQLKYLYEELGPLVTGEYCISLGKELSRSRFEGESAEEYKTMVKRLRFLSEFCLQQCRDKTTHGESSNNCKKNGGRTDKLIALEILLKRLLTNDTMGDGTFSEKVGLVFVERRITAVALYNYFKNREGNGPESADHNVNGHITDDDDTKCDKIRCEMLVRQSHQIFKYLHFKHKMGNNSFQCQEKAKQLEREWIHQTKNIRSVLDKLRRGETNLLIATSVVEEGVDVTACSFVIVLDGIKTTKGYVQMKGRARRKNAIFCCFQDLNPSSPTPPVALEDAQDVEKVVTDFLSRRQQMCKSVMPKQIEPNTNPTACSEESALRSEEYCTTVARVDLRSAKSVLNQYFLAIPMDQRARSSRKTMVMQMPIYSETTLILPSHLPSAIRHVSLPEKYCVTKKKREEMLALMAMVRLHKLKLINDNLLPLKRKDLLDIVYRRVLQTFPQAPSFTARIVPPPLGGGTKQVYLYPLLQSGQCFDQHDEVLKSRGRHLGICSTESLPAVSDFSFDHSELGLISCKLGEEAEVQMTGDEWLQCASFFAVLINSRWRKRTGKKYFSYNKAGGTFSKIIPPFIVVSLTEHRCLDWERMKKVITENSRTESERMPATASMNEPRLWSPKYDPNVTYISFSESSFTCGAPFPDTNEEIKTYSDYFLKKRGFEVSPNCKLFNVQRLWNLPRKFHFSVNQQKEADVPHKKHMDLQEIENTFCTGLPHVKLPQDACLEAPIADASLLLHCVMLPQILYHLDRWFTAHSFISHCCEHNPALGKYLGRIDINFVLESITAQSCTIDGHSYDRLEYLGDAVLKVLHTDALLHSPLLMDWVACLHEGDLSTLRSAMGCNERLKDAAVSAGIDRYILLVPLARGLWIPNGLHAEILDQNGNISIESESYSPSMKVCADVVEALMGLVYLHFGFTAADEVASCLGITLPQGRKLHADNSVEALRPEVQHVAESFLGIEGFSNTSLLKEAITHASFVNTDVPSYQKLEWVGDAVLTLAVREWAYKKFSELSVATLVVAEATIVCNETLAYLAWRKGLHRIIQHCDPSLPGRIENFALGIRPEELGLWGTDPPKILADVVEALLGAVHTEMGFSKGQNTTLFVVSPMLHAISEKMPIDKNGIVRANSGAMMHPKQQLFQLVNFLKVRIMKEHEFATRFRNPKPIWCNGTWKKPSLHGDSIVCHISCFGVDIIALSEPFSSVAQNRACAVATEILSCHPVLMKKIQQLASNLVKDQ